MHGYRSLSPAVAESPFHLFQSVSRSAFFSVCGGGERRGLKFLEQQLKAPHADTQGGKNAGLFTYQPHDWLTFSWCNYVGKHLWGRCRGSLMEYRERTPTTATSTRKTTSKSTYQEHPIDSGFLYVTSDGMCSISCKNRRV